jgi:hypothetical protein
MEFLSGLSTAFIPTPSGAGSRIAAGSADELNQTFQFFSLRTETGLAADHCPWRCLIFRGLPHDFDRSSTPDASRTPASRAAQAHAKKESGEETEGRMSTQQFQFQIDFERRLPVSAQIGMATCDANADGRWKREVDAAIRQVALTHATFTADEVVAELERNNFHFTTHNGSALGPRLKEVSKTLGYMKATDQVKRSTRPASKGNFLRVWESKICR